MKTPRQMKKEDLVFLTEQIQHLLYLDAQDRWDPDKKWDARTIADLKDIMHTFGLVPDRAR